MAKVTEQDVINYLQQKVDQLTKDLEAAQAALLAFQGSAGATPPVKRGRKPNAAPKKNVLKTDGAKRGRKPRLKETPSEQIIVADQLG
jgi:hypothetical protein